MLFNNKQKRAEKACQMVFSYINSTANRFANLFFDETHRKDIIVPSVVVLIHYVRYIFNVEDTILEMYFRAREFPVNVQKGIMDVYYEFKDYMLEEEAENYYGTMCLLNMFSRAVEDPYNHILDLRYGQLIYALEHFLDDYNLQWKSSSKNLPVNQDIYWFFVEEEPTIKPIQKKVVELFN